MSGNRKGRRTEGPSREPEGELRRRLEEAEQALAAERLEHKRMEEALRVSEQRFRVIVEAVQDYAIFMLDPGGNVISWNAGAQRIKGYKAEEIIGRNFSILYAPEDLDHGKAQSELAAAVRDGCMENEGWRVRKDGSRFWANIVITALRDEAGHLRGFTKIVRDITDRKQAEETVAAAHRQVQSIIDNTTSIVYAFDLEERFLLANTALAELLHSTPEQMIGKRRHEFMPQEDADWHEANDRQAIQAGKALEFEERSQLEGRSITWLTTKFPLRDAQGRIYAVAGISADVSARRQAEAKLAYQATLLANVSDAVIGFDTDFHVTSWNRAAERIYGYSAEEAIGRRAIEVLRRDYEGVSREEVLRELRESGHLEADFYQYTKEGRKLYVESRTMAIKDTNGKTVGWVGVNRDITERKRAEEALQEANEQLQAQTEELRTQAEELTTANEELRQSEQARGESEARYRSLAENMPSVLMRYDRQMRVVYLSPQAEDITGIPTRQFLGKTNRQVGMPEDLCSLWEKAIDEVFRTERNQDLEFSFASPQGPKTFYLKLAPEFDAHGAVTYVLGISTDITERKQIEEKARSLAHVVAQEKDRLAALVDSITDEIWFADAAGEFTLVNPSGVQEFALDTAGPTDVKGLAARLEVLRPDGSPRPVEETPPLRALRGEVVRNAEEIIRTPASGVLRYRQVSSSPVRDAGGHIIGSVSVVRDITERKRAEEALRQSEARFHRVFTSNVAALALWDAQGRFLEVNDRFLGLIGYTRAQFEAGQVRWDEATPAEMRPRDYEAVQELQAGREISPYEKEFVRPDGSRVPVLIGGSILPGTPDIGVAFAVDITERKRAEGALRETRDYLDNLFNYANAPIIVWDPQFKITRFNAAFEHLTGRQAQEVLGREIDILFPPDSREESLAHIRRTTSQKERWEVIEIRILHTSGDVRTVLWNSANVLAPDNETVIATIAQGQDITERKQAEESLRELNATLENKVIQRTMELQQRTRQLQKLTLEVSQAEDRERKRMAEILHDDLQQIIAGAKFHLSLMRNRVKHDASLQTIAVQIDQMLKEAIEKSRGLSHELSPAVLHHGDFIETLGWLARQMQAKHGLTVNVQANGPMHPPSEAMNSFLYKAAQELLFNVVKHARVKEARIHVRRHGRNVCLSVSDRGCGFDPQRLPETAGFGLLGIRERIELLGGRMKIKSASGKGSTFFIVVPDGPKSEDAVGVGRVPKRNESRLGSPPRAYPTFATLDGDGGKEGGHGGPPLRVLLADDHRIVRESLRLLLSEEYDIKIVGEAVHGREAVDLALRLEPDVIIMDVAMPLIDGDEATRQIKTHLPQTRVIALSTYNEPETIGKMYRAGAESYVLKTASPAELLAAIRGKPA